MTGKEARNLSDEEIAVELDRLKKRRYELRASAVTEKVEDSSEFMKVRRDIARLLTERRARDLAAVGSDTASTEEASA